LRKEEKPANNIRRQFGFRGVHKRSGTNFTRGAKNKKRVKEKHHRERACSTRFRNWQVECVQGKQVQTNEKLK